MQVKDERLKELLTKIATNGGIECPDSVDCFDIPTNYEQCIKCWTEYLKQQIW